MIKVVPFPIFVSVELRPLPLGKSHIDIVVKITEEDFNEHLRSVKRDVSSLVEQGVQEEIASRAINWARTALDEKRNITGGQKYLHAPNIISEQLAMGLTAGKPRLPAKGNGVEIWEVT